MLREILTRIMDEYPVARTQPFLGNKFAQFIRQDVPERLKRQFESFTNIIWVGSAGQGRWADAPWIAALDLLVTNTPQDGYYPVYLFTRTLDSVYLSLIQGMTRLRAEFGASQAKEILSKRALILRTRLQEEYSTRFSNEPINLQSLGHHSRLAFYESSHVFGIKYTKAALPDDAQLMNDLKAMLSLYRVATERGGFEEFDTRHSLIEENHSYEAEASLDEKRRLRLHYVIERNSYLSKLAKNHHGYRCQVCNFDYEKAYGELGRRYIEAHHLTPLSLLPPNTPVKLSAVADFAVLCANCHRMIHRKGAPDTFKGFRSMYQSLNSHLS